MGRSCGNAIRCLLLALVLGVGACSKVSEDDNRPGERYSPEQLAALNGSTLPLEGSDPTLPDEELAPLADLGQALVVGLGEATHGTHEFFAMKHRLFRYLVERFDFRAFAFECDYGESLYFDSWLNGGAGDLDDLMRKKMHFWTWRTVEVKALLEWMRQVNLSRPEAERLHYIGVDCQFATFQPALLREYLGRVSPQHLTEIEPLLAREEAFRDSDFANLSDAECRQLQLDLVGEYEAWENRRDEFAQRSSLREFAVARRLLRSLVQVNKVRSALLSADEANPRDRQMAENTLWVQQEFGADRGIALWAHNAHVANSVSFDSMGWLLRGTLGKRYAIVGFSFCQGTFNARGFDPVRNVATDLQTHSIAVPPLPYSVNDLFFAAENKAFVFRLDRLAAESPLQVWFSRPLKMLNIGAVYNGNPETCYGAVLLRENYDILIHFNLTTFAPQLQ